MKYNLKPQPKWVQKHIEGLEAKLDLARELLSSTPLTYVVEDEYALEPITNALYSTGKFTTDECSVLGEGILTFIKDYGYIICKTKKGK